MAADAVLAATARALAGKLDGFAGPESATAAQVAPRLAAQLVDVLAPLRERAPREPDSLELLKRRRDARLAGVSHAPNGTPR